MKLIDKLTKVFIKSKQSLVQSNNDLIEEIHQSFLTEVDNLLEQAKITNEIDKMSYVDALTKGHRLQKLGFRNTKEVKESKEISNNIAKIEGDNLKKKELIEAINYFSQKHPLYKFITEDSVKKICSKYGLVYGSVDKYIGDVPDKNLKEIENFKIADEDRAYVSSRYSRLTGRTIQLIINYKEYQHHKLMELRDAMNPVFSAFDRVFSYSSAPLEIAALPKDFNMDEWEIRDFKLEEKARIPDNDPIVLQPVMFKDSKYYLIVTAWGKEASDSNVVNEKMN